MPERPEPERPGSDEHRGPGDELRDHEELGDRAEENPHAHDEDPTQDPAAGSSADPVPGAEPSGGALSDTDYDDRFADIVAHWNSAPAGERAPGAAEAPRPEVPPHDPSSLGHDPLAPRREPNPALEIPPGWRVHTPPPEPEEDFVPPPPRPLPAGDLGFWGALLGLVGGPLWLVYVAAVDPHGMRLQALLAILLTLAGFAIVVGRLPRRYRDEDPRDDDDGAIV